MLWPTLIYLARSTGAENQSQDGVGVSALRMGLHYEPPILGFSQGERLQYHRDGLRLIICPSRKRMALRPLWRGIGPPQFGSPPVTPPVSGASSPGSWRIQQPGFSGVAPVTHLSGSLVLSGLLPESAM